MVKYKDNKCDLSIHNLSLIHIEIIHYFATFCNEF